MGTDCVDHRLCKLQQFTGREPLLANLHRFHTRFGRNGNDLKRSVATEPPGIGD
jgi:hypothetical protein